MLEVVSGGSVSGELGRDSVAGGMEAGSGELGRDSVAGGMEAGSGDLEVLASGTDPGLGFWLGSVMPRVNAAALSSPWRSSTCTVNCSCNKKVVNHCDPDFGTGLLSLYLMVWIYRSTPSITKGCN